MAKHAARRDTGRHRAPARPRYGRIAAFTAALTVTSVAVAGGFGLLPGGADEPAAASPSGSRADSSPADSAADSPADSSPAASPAAPVDTPKPEELAALDGPATGDLADTSSQVAAVTDSTSLPARSGSGRRIVFSEGRQRVWLVDGDGEVERTYLVSGSVEDNLDPGTYAVYSRSRNAIGVDDSGTMEYFVRFTQGTQGAAIGFHTIPVDEGRPVQTRAELGTPRSHGCIRQARPNAIALWEFAPVGTKVVVTA
ncbi:L,D-transpeptidase [Nocardioides albidus]|uniref:L,D-transpeptidase n=1 Tax=Nocardioides albidus TaxID=1517589 RepID=A0A5C4VP48_9ACTN|nr:L,D-transpeptidase [Nocardioides albidus]TNM37561.1 L,D-transpeptidase [Nocardioides albidus]